MRKKQERKDSSPMEKAMGLTSLASGQTDPAGSYTGQPDDRWEKPVQDADDL